MFPLQVEMYHLFLDELNVSCKTLHTFPHHLLCCSIGGGCLRTQKDEMGFGWVYHRFTLREL